MSFDPQDPRITAYVLGELPAAEQAAFEAQMAASSQLRQLVVETRQTVDMLATEMKSEPPILLTTQERERLENAICELPQPAAKSTEGRRTVRVFLAFAALAASLLLIAGLGRMWLWGRRALHETAMETSHRVDFLGGVSSIDERKDVLRTPAPRSGETVRQKRPDSGITGRSADSSGEATGTASTALAVGPGSAGPGPGVMSSNGSSPYSSVAPRAESLGMPGTAPGVFRDARRNGGENSLSEVSRDPPRAIIKPAGTSELMPGLGDYGGMMPGSGDMGEGAYGMLGMVPSSGASGGMMPSSVPSGGTMGDVMVTPGAGAMPGRNQVTAGYGAAGEHAGMSAPADRLDRFTPVPGMAEPPREAGVYLEQRAQEVARPDLGRGPGESGDRHQPITDNPFREVRVEPLSTFSIDVDTASYSKVRMYLMERNMLPRPDAVRIEELINYFPYDYSPPTDGKPFAAHLEVADCPWRPGHRLVRIGIQGQQMDRNERPVSNLVFLLDVSGSMNQPNKLPLLQRGMKMLVDQLNENDKVAIIVYAGAAGMVLDSTPGSRKQVLLEALDRLQAGGSTNGGDGIRLAYQTALDHFVKGGVNRVILCTDGDFNVGVTGTDELVRLAQENAKAGVFLSVLGFGMGNHNDAMLEQIADKGNGNYAFIDTDIEARKVLVEQMSGTLVAIAKDVKLQVEFNPREVRAYRLIGYENRMLAAQDFNDDKKDAGEIGAGHTVTALYEIVPADGNSDVTVPPVDELRYQDRGKPGAQADSGELLTLKIRYKQPDGETSTKLEFPLRDGGQKFGQATRDFRFVTAVAAFGMLLRNSEHKGNSTYAGVLEIAQESAGNDPSGYRKEFLRLVERAKSLAGG